MGPKELLEEIFSFSESVDARIVKVLLKHKVKPSDMNCNLSDLLKEQDSLLRDWNMYSVWIGLPPTIEAEEERQELMEDSEE